MIESSTAFRSIRSFVRREGRMTPAQRRALAQLWPRYGLETGDTPFDFARIFGRRAPVVLEIGFGDGEVLAAMAAAHPQNDYLGVEVHRPGVGALLRRLAAQNLANVRVVVADAKEVLRAHVADGALAAVHLFFPDPWPKQRHHKRRLVQPDFAALVAGRLAPGGYFHVATDWLDYAEHIAAVLAHTPGMVEQAARAEEFARPPTRFERRGRRLGHPVRDLVYRRSV
jgi:tRNA (guanine-N7-)-methyltransferase